MTDPGCRRWVEDPEGEKGHLASCAECRRDAEAHEALEQRLAAVAAEPGALPPAELPVAPWEGAQHRAWGVVVLALLGVAAIAGGLFFALGISPFAAIAEIARTAAGSRKALLLVTESLGNLLPAAPGRFNAGVALGFVAVNAVLYFMLRRGLRGYDVRSR